MQKMAKVKPAFQEQGIEWLVLQEDSENTGGVFLYLHTSLENPCDYDLWYENLEQAINQANSLWGVRETDWVTLADGQAVSS